MQYSRLDDQDLSFEDFSKTVQVACHSRLAPVNLYHVLLELLKLTEKMPCARPLKVKKAEEKAKDLVKLYQEKYSPIILEDCLLSRRDDLVENAQKALEKMRDEKARCLIGTILEDKLGTGLMRLNEVQPEVASCG